jgi:hypothetical protein
MKNLRVLTEAEIQQVAGGVRSSSGDLAEKRKATKKAT